MADSGSRDIMFGNYFRRLFEFTADTSLDKTENQYLLEMCESVSAKGIEDLYTLKILAHLYTELGEYANGLEIDLKLSSLLPDDPTVWYNLACSYSLLYRLEECIEVLETAITLGYDDIEHLDTDPDLDPVRETDEYRELISRLMFREGLK